MQRSVLRRLLHGRRTAVVTAAVVALASAGVVAMATSASAAAGCQITYSVPNQWPGGFTAYLTVTNLGDPIANGWTLRFAFPAAGQAVASGWSATWSQSGANVSAVNLDWNKALATNGSTQIGFNGAWTSSNPSPTTFTLNGTTCTGTPPSNPPSSPATSPSASRSASPSASPSRSASPSASPSSSSSTPSGTPVGINGQLHVCGVNLCNQFNRPIQLRGMSTHGLQWFAACYNNASLNALANDWHADVLRIAMYVQEQGYETNPTAFTNQVNSLVDQAEARGMYAIIDFHILTPGDPLFNLDRAKTFFAAVAARNSAKKNVIYEIANEPNGVSWSTIKSYAEQVIPVIRSADPDGVVIVGTRGWSSLGVSDGSNETEVVNNPVNATNVMYTFHFYAASHGDNYRQVVARAAASLPIFVTEFGTVTFTGGGTVDIGSSTTWLDLLDSKKISYANWTYSDANESSAAFVPGTCAGSNYGTGVLSQSGTFLRSRINTPDNFPTS